MLGSHEIHSSEYLVFLEEYWWFRGSGDASGESQNHWYSLQILRCFGGPMRGPVPMGGRSGPETWSGNPPTKIPDPNHQYSLSFLTYFGPRFSRFCGISTKHYLFCFKRVVHSSLHRNFSGKVPEIVKSGPYKVWQKRNGIFSQKRASHFCL